MFDDDPRWGSAPRERVDDARDRDAVDPRNADPRDVFVNTLDLPRGPERELVRDRDCESTLRGSESRTLSIVGSFRVVSSRDLRDHDNRPADPEHDSQIYRAYECCSGVAHAPGAWRQECAVIFRRRSSTDYWSNLTGMFRQSRGRYIVRSEVDRQADGSGGHPRKLDFAYTEMVKIWLDLPDNAIGQLAEEGRDLSRTALEALAIDAYRTNRITAHQLCTLLEIASRYELDGFLKQHGVPLEYSVDDFEREGATSARLWEKRQAERAAEDNDQRRA